jgi:hypothetical protein
METFLKSRDDETWLPQPDNGRSSADARASRIAKALEDANKMFGAGDKRL